ncbi:MAG: type II secretion system protein [Bacilli bacterium]|jgi:prepilin-type N-terminal cleavage/methylation domain-containing protein|nr:type II secretion system protein [Bacilli bacterium]
MKTKKGFTLAELLAVLGIIGLLITVASTSVVSVVTKQKETLRKDTEKKLKDAAVAYTQEKRIYLKKCPEVFDPANPTSTNQNCYKYIKIGDIISAGLFTDNQNSCDRNQQILVYKETKTNYSETKAYAPEGICK